MSDLIGWAATALFAASYFFKRPAAMRRTQALAAVVWMVYGAVIHALPVVVANIIVATLALWSSFASPARTSRRGDAPAEPVPLEDAAS